jgi:hypothetical protein
MEGKRPKSIMAALKYLPEGLDEANQLRLLAASKATLRGGEILKSTFGKGLVLEKGRGNFSQ